MFLNIILNIKNVFNVLKIPKHAFNNYDAWELSLSQRDKPRILATCFQAKYVALIERDRFHQDLWCETTTKSYAMYSVSRAW